MRDSKGFTVIELLIVIVIIGIVAAIAIPKFSATRERAYFAAMRSDLRNLAAQQEIYYADNYVFSGIFADLAFVSTDGVNVMPTSVSSSGWAASATHSALGATEGCAIFYGTATAPFAPITPPEPGELVCTR